MRRVTSKKTSIILLLLLLFKVNSENLEEHLQSLARDGVQVLFAALFSLPTKSSPDGPLAILPTPTYQLPRAKPLPKPKPLTKWEQFAAAKGIQKTVREKRVWDEEKQEWVNRWGRDGKNKEVEQAWITEVPANAGQFLLLLLISFVFNPSDDHMLNFFFVENNINN